MCHVGVAEAQIQAQGSEHLATGGEDEQPHSLGGHHYTLTEGESVRLSLPRKHGTCLVGVVC